MATHPRWLLGSILALALAGAACSNSGTAAHVSPRSSGSSSGYPVTLTDDNGVKVTLASPPQRIVTFAPSMTEILFALGEGSRVVGVSGSSDNYPPPAKRIEGIGAGEFGTEPNIEKVVSLHPDLFLYAFGGTASWMSRLRSLGIPVFTAISTSFPDLLHDIRTVGELTGRAQAADALTSRMQRSAATTERAVATSPHETCFFEEG
jgi:iron complex transport system substrate-binding protein